MTYLEYLLSELNNVSEEDMGIFCPSREVREGEKIIGELNLDERKMCAYAEKQQMEIADKVKKMDEDDLTPEEAKAANKELDEIELIQEIFWKSVNDRLMSEGIKTGSMRIGKDWKIISLPDSEPTLSVERLFTFPSKD